MGQKKRTKSSDIANVDCLNSRVEPEEICQCNGVKLTPNLITVSTPEETASTKKPWRKLLYGNTDYPDNYTDSSFLEELRKNLHIQKVDFNIAVIETLVVTRQICLLVNFVLIFVYLENGLWHPLGTFLITTVITASVYWYTVKTKLSQNVFMDVKTAVIFLAVTYALSPVLRNLTDTISTDTIYAMTVFMMLIHLIFKNYSIEAALVSDTFSTNSAIFASVCLGSRLPTSFHAFILLTLAVEVFVLFPMLMKQIKIPPVAVFIYIIFVTVCLLHVCAILGILLLIVICFINLLCPLWYCKWQLLKANLYGPWDEAVIQSLDEKKIKKYT